MNPPYWTRNDRIIGSELNITFHELLSYTEDQITKWVDDVRAFVLKVWDEEGFPPRAGKTKSEIVQAFRDLEGYPVHEFAAVDEITGNPVILNQTNAGTCLDQFFPTMMKTQINYATSMTDEGKFRGISVYDLFKDNRWRKRMQTGFRRHFRRDSFYKFGKTLSRGDIPSLASQTGRDFAIHFSKFKQAFQGSAYWICRVSSKKTRDTGYIQMDRDKYLSLSVQDIRELHAAGHLQGTTCANLGDISTLQEDSVYHIRMYDVEDRIFPHGFTAFKIGYVQVAVNFPSMTAKYLYEKYTKHVQSSPQEPITIYDPSAGWGGRILGAMAVEDSKYMHYVGTDPNPDNYLTELGVSRYQYVADFFNRSTYRSGFFSHANTYEIFQECAEDIHRSPAFQKYGGRVDIVFTSPPYFNREGYCMDEKQSMLRWPRYEDWRNNFLRPTLETAVRCLRRDRYLLWNIADIRIGDKYLPLEGDSKHILHELGMEYKGVELMALVNMPGGNRIGEDGLPTAKNYCKVKGKFFKAEPIHVFYKP